MCERMESPASAADCTVCTEKQAPSQHMELESLLFYDLVPLTARHWDWRRGPSASSLTGWIEILSLFLPPHPLTHMISMLSMYVNFHRWLKTPLFCMFFCRFLPVQNSNDTCSNKPTLVAKPHYRQDLFNRKMSDVLFTAVLVTTIGNHTLGHFGTSDGRILQVAIWVIMWRASEGWMCFCSMLILNIIFTCKHLYIFAVRSRFIWRLPKMKILVTLPLCFVLFRWFLLCTGRSFMPTILWEKPKCPGQWLCTQKIHLSL